jgi:hypothetical protein
MNMNSQSMNYCSVVLISMMIIFSSCTSSEDPQPIDDDNLIVPEEGGDVPMNATATSMGTFSSFAHGLSGNAVLYVQDQGKRTLRLENFSMTEGPDVYVLFSKTNNYSEANTIAISRLKSGYSNTSLNFELNDTLDLSTHKFVLVYCVQFSSLFGYSELKQ